MNADGGGTYTLSHVDLGARVHFRTGTNIVVPFIQFGLSGRDERQDVTTASGTHTVSANGAGLSFGAGLNAHFNPSWAFSGSVTWTVGNFSNYQVDNEDIGGSSVNATSARVHAGIIWFPGA
jgi:outer membrane autotransporter protein